MVFGYNLSSVCETRYLLCKDITRGVLCMVSPLFCFPWFSWHLFSGLDMSEILCLDKEIYQFKCFVWNITFFTYLFLIQLGSAMWLHNTSCILTKGLWKKHAYALVNVNSHGLPQGDSDRSIWTHTVDFDSLILTHSGDIWQIHFNPGKFWPQFENIVAYF